MFKKFLDGLATGAGFGISFLAVGIVAIYFVLPRVTESRFSTGGITHGEQVTGTVPSIGESRRFLGSPATYSSGFLDNKSGVLSSGPGKIIGSASVNGEPVEGLRLRLALNGSVLSQWVTTDSSGRYVVGVPYAKYAIDGFELDSRTADEVLANKIDHPQGAHSSGAFDVSAENDGRGLDFRFVDPIIKKVGKKKYSATEDVVLEWEPYPNAADYSVQIYEKQDPYSWTNDTLFEWSRKPRLSEARFDPKEHGARLKPGYFYVFEVEARDKQQRVLSETARTHSDYDFEVVE